MMTAISGWSLYFVSEYRVAWIGEPSREEGKEIGWVSVAAGWVYYRVCFQMEYLY
jgi:hypothetical protein